jgi:uncharacterized membrane protein YeaQ/YmgE (transglycosylase-associated protein family)
MQSLLIALLIGAVAGWLAGQIKKGEGYGLLGNIVVGIIGGFVGGLVANFFGVTSTNIIGQVIISTFGAVILLTILNLFSK